MGVPEAYVVDPPVLAINAGTVSPLDQARDHPEVRADVYGARAAALA
jgi:hypothetical protein